MVCIHPYHTLLARNDDVGFAQNVPSCTVALLPWYVSTQTPVTAAPEMERN